MDKHDTLLLCCESSKTRKQLRDILAERYHLLEATSISQAMLLRKQNSDCIAAVLLNLSDSDQLHPAGGRCL